MARDEKNGSGSSRLLGKQEAKLMPVRLTLEPSADAGEADAGRMADAGEADARTHHRASMPRRKTLSLNNREADVMLARLTLERTIQILKN